MAISPVDKSEEFLKSGMKLITDPASDALLKKAKLQSYKTPPEDRYSRPCGGSHGFDDFVERWHE